MTATRTHRGLRSTVGAMCVTAAAIAASVVASWIFNFNPFADVTALPLMKMNTAVGVILSAAGVWLLQDEDAHSRAVSLAAGACGLVAMAVGVLTTWEVFGRVDLGLDAILIPARSLQLSPIRMEGGASLMLSATGCGVFLLSRRWVVSAQWCALVVVLLGVCAVQAWIYAVLDIHTIPELLAIGPHTTLAYFCLSLALLAARSNRGVTRVFSGDTPGGLMGRRLWLPLVLLTWGAGTLTEWLESVHRLTDGTDSPFIVGWFALLSSLLIWLNARSLNRLDDRLHRTIDERISAEQLLRRQASLFDQAYEGMVISKRDGPITFWNKGAEHLYGFSRDEAVGQLAPDLLSTTVVGGAAQMHDHLRRNRYWEGELHHRHKEGQTVIVATRMTLVDDAGGSFVVAASRDITERVRAEAALRESERRFREIAEWLPQMVWTCDPDGWCDYLSRRWLDYTGSSLTKEVGYGWLNQIHPDDQEQLTVAWKSCVDTAQELRLEFRIRRYDGVYRWFDTRALPLRDEAGSVVKWFGSNTDIEDERAIREALRSNEERLALALDINQTAAWDFDVATNVVHRSLAHDRIFGYESIQTNWTFEDFLTHVIDDDRDRIRRRFERSMTAVDDWSFDCRIRRVDGEVRWIAVRGRTKRNADGTIRTLSGVVQDVTARKEIEEEIKVLNVDLEWRVEQRTQELEAANRELEAFSYSVSHDLRAPLRTVDGFSQAVLEDHADTLPIEGQRYLKIIRDGAQRMGRLIDDLLSFSRLSRQPLAVKPVNMEFLVRDSWDEVASQQQGQRVDITIEPLPDANGDPSLLKQVWVNLLSNALKYSRGRTTPCIRVGSHREDGVDVYFVRDNGTGFDMQYSHKLFGVFQRLHRSEDFEGTGVGLAVVHRIVSRHGGRIWADAALDRGATFFFTLEAGKRTS